MAKLNFSKMSEEELTVWIEVEVKRLVEPGENEARVISLRFESHRARYFARAINNKG
jgi:hypothetical protein